MAKNCLLSIDSDNKNNSGAIKAYSKKGKNCPTTHAYSNNSNSHHFNRSSYAKTSKGHQKWIVEHELTGPSGADHKIDIIRKKSSKDKGAFPYQL
jgi:hypothetical protein